MTRLSPFAVLAAVLAAGCSPTGLLLGDPDDDDSGLGDDDVAGDDDDAIEVDCGALPQGPFEYGIVFGPKATEDMAFDDQGHVLGADEGNLFKSTYEGDYELWVPGAGGFIAGMRALPTGDVVYADVSSGTLFRVEPSGAKTAVLSGLQYANGIEVDLDGLIYVAEQNGSRVRRIDPYTGEYDIVAEDLYNPNGLTFDPTYTTLYIGSFEGGTIHTVTFDADGEPGPAELFIDGLGSGLLDGMGVDACGNVYVCEYWVAILWRISPDGQQREAIVDFSQDTEWIPNMQWGSGLGGWAEDHLYVLDITASKMFEVPLGVPAKPRAWP
jgi:hypothetical protein